MISGIAAHIPDEPKPPAVAVGSSDSSASVLRVVLRGETEPQYASRLVWWIAHLADWTKPVKVGDTVVEVTHRMGLARHQLGLHSALGELLKIEEEREGTTYTIRDIEGQERRWTNCKMCLVEASLPNNGLASNQLPITPPK